MYTNIPMAEQWGSSYYPTTSYVSPLPETKAEFIRKFVSQHYGDMFPISVLIEDAETLWDASVRSNEKI